MAATAFGLWGMQSALWSWGYPTPWSGRLWNLDEGWSAKAVHDRIPTAILLILPTLAAVTAAVFVLRFLRPRPALRDVWRQPGAVACVLILASVAVKAIDQVDSILGSAGLATLLRVLGDSQLFPELPMHILATSVAPAAYAVLAGWLVLWLGGQGTAESSWVDRAGRALGACWIAFALILWLERSHFKGHIPILFLDRG